MRGRDADEPAPHVLHANGIDAAVAECGLDPPPHVERIRLPRRGLPAFGAVGDERPREAPHLRRSQRRAVSVVILSYVSARLIGDHYFNHALRLCAASPLGCTELDRDKDADPIEEIIWGNLRCERPPSALSQLEPELERKLIEEDARIREELTDGVRNDEGDWLGAVWAIAATVLVSR